MLNTVDSWTHNKLIIHPILVLQFMCWIMFTTCCCLHQQLFQGFKYVHNRLNTSEKRSLNSSLKNFIKKIKNHLNEAPQKWVIYQKNAT